MRVPAAVTCSAVERVVARLPHQVDEHVVERRLGFLPGKRAVSAVGLNGFYKRGAVGPANMQRRAKGGGSRHARRAVQLWGQPVRARPAGDESDEDGLLDYLG